MGNSYLIFLLLLLVSSIASSHAIKQTERSYSGVNPPPQFCDDVSEDGNLLAHHAVTTAGDDIQCECPLIEQIEYRDFKANLAPTIHQRLKELSRKSPTLESAIETAHSIGLLKLLRESNPKLDKIRDDLHHRAQELKKLFEEVDKHMDEEPTPVL